MIIGGIVRNSFVDYPKKIACVIFTRGCNFKCWYCHNSHLLGGGENKIDEETLFKFLNERKNFLDGVVISGGEPTLQNDLIDFIKKVKKIGYSVKLDTNGTKSEILKQILDENLVDYVAMDIKAPLEDYEKIVCSKPLIDEVKKSIKLLLSSNIDYEFRTTFSPDLTVDDIEKICKNIVGAKKYCIQKYRQVDYNEKNMPLKNKEDHILAEKVARKYINDVELRGL